MSIACSGDRSHFYSAEVTIACFVQSDKQKEGLSRMMTQESPSNRNLAPFQSCCEDLYCSEQKRGSRYLRLPLKMGMKKGKRTPTLQRLFCLDCPFQAISVLLGCYWLFGSATPCLFRLLGSLGYCFGRLGLLGRLCLYLCLCLLLCPC